MNSIRNKTVLISSEEYTKLLNELKKKDEEINNLKKQLNNKKTNSKQEKTSIELWNEMIEEAYSANDAYDLKKYLKENLNKAIESQKSKEELTKLKKELVSASRSFGAYKGHTTKKANNFTNNSIPQDFQSVVRDEKTTIAMESLEKARKNFKNALNEKSSQEKINTLYKEVIKARKNFYSLSNKAEKSIKNKETFLDEEFTKEEIETILNKPLNQLLTGMIEREKKFTTINKRVDFFNNNESKSPKPLKKIPLKNLCIKISNKDSNKNKNQKTNEETEKVKEELKRILSSHSQETISEEQIEKIKEELRKNLENSQEEAIPGTIIIGKKERSKNPIHFITKIRKSIKNQKNKMIKKIKKLTTTLIIIGILGAIIPRPNTEKDQIESKKSNCKKLHKTNKI